MSQHVRPKYWNLRRYSLLSRVCSFNRNVTYTSFVWVIKNIQAVCTCYLSRKGNASIQTFCVRSLHLVLLWSLTSRLWFQIPNVEWCLWVCNHKIRNRYSKRCFVNVIWHVARNLWDIFMFYKTKVINNMSIASRIFLCISYYYQAVTARNTLNLT